VILDLNVNKDSVGEVFNGVPSIDTRTISTQVLVANGETVVLGGIYEENRIDTNTRVPFFADIPILGKLFQKDEKRNDRSELLIFVTPKIVKEDLQSAVY
jgi:type IV pilus assembly protein PilQ